MALFIFSGPFNVFLFYLIKLTKAFKTGIFLIVHYLALYKLFSTVKSHCRGFKEPHMEQQVADPCCKDTSVRRGLLDHD